MMRLNASVTLTHAGDKCLNV